MIFSQMGQNYFSGDIELGQAGLDTLDLKSNLDLVTGISAASRHFFKAAFL